MIEKPMKPFLVNNSVIFVEQHQVVLPEIENESRGLVGQMRSYTVERRSSTTGAPVYSQGKDHILDAWMLAMLGFTLRRSDLGVGQMVQTVRHTDALSRPVLSRLEDRWPLGKGSIPPLGTFAPERGPALADVAAAHGLPYSYTRDPRPEDLRPKRDASSRRRGYKEVRNSSLIRSRRLGPPQPGARSTFRPPLRRP